VAEAWCGGTRGSGRPFYRWSGRGKEGGTAGADELAMMAVMEQTMTGWLGQARGEGTARVQWRRGS
jgi:hypothetical protein